MPGQPHRGIRYITMFLSFPTTDIAPFGTYPNYLAARLDCLKTARGHSQFEAYCK